MSPFDFLKNGNQDPMKIPAERRRVIICTDGEIDWTKIATPKPIPKERITDIVI